MAEDRFEDLASSFESLREALRDSRNSGPCDFRFRIDLLRHMRMILLEMHVELARLGPDGLAPHGA